MLVYQDLLTGDELLSDSFAYKEIENGMLWEVDGKWVVKGAIDVDIGANPSEGGEDEGVDDTALKVVDIGKVWQSCQTCFCFGSQPQQQKRTHLRALLYGVIVEAHLLFTEAAVSRSGPV